MKRAAALLAAALLGAAPVAAAPTPSGPPAPGTVLYPGGGGAPESFSHAGGASAYGWAATAFIGAAAAGAIWLWWRRRLGEAGPTARGERKLAIAETRPLGNRQYLVVADYGGRKFRLGVCPGRIDLLAPLDRDAHPGA